MRKLDVVQAWLDNVAYAHSNSESTEYVYRHYFKRFCDFIERSPQQILDEYEETNDRQFKRKYAAFLRAYISATVKEGYASGSVSTIVNPVKSFFMYNDLPLGYVPVGKCRVTYHNRDIAKHEIIEVMKISPPRTRAFYCMMAQSGLRPKTLCNLKIKHIEPDFSKGIIPCCITVPAEITKGQFGGYFSFMGEDSVNNLRSYFKTRGVLGAEDYVFTAQGGRGQFSSKSVSILFSRLVDQLKTRGILQFNQVKGKPRELRLYNLRKYFRKQAHHGDATIEYVNFWMGHRANYKAPHIPASDDHYASRENIEFQRQLYREHSMPHLRLETATPSETEKTIEEMRMELDELRQENLKLKERLNGYVLSESQVSELLRRIEKLEKQAKS